VLVAMNNISKSFGADQVLRDVSFDVAPGEVHVLAGANGAGKSTLIKILSGVVSGFSGELRVEGAPARFGGPVDAIRAGIATIHQELSLVGSMSVTDNLFLGRERTNRIGAVSRAAQRREAARILAELELDIDPAAAVEDLPISAQQLVEIARALARDARVLVMDEPTSALSEVDARTLFARIERVREQGKGIVFITHRMDEIYAVAHRITVLRDGVRVGTEKPADLPRDTLIAWMAGLEIAKPSLSGAGGPPLQSPGPGAEPGTPGESPAHPEIVLEVQDLRVFAGRRVSASELPLIDGVSFQLRRGEILGLAGLRDSGASQLLEALFGAHAGAIEGRVLLAGAEVRNGSRSTLDSPARAIERGVILLPADRKTSGIIPDLGITENATLASLGHFSTLGWIRTEDERAAVHSLADRFRIRATSLDVPVARLSGGNQQKVCVARCAMVAPKVLLLDEPTRGVDVAAKADIHQAMREWANQGVAIVLATSELDELLALGDRVLVLHRGRVAARFERAEATREAVLHAAMGRRRDPS
jgi:ABC-type sugar transport system ATPase subunit